MPLGSGFSELLSALADDDDDAQDDHPTGDADKDANGDLAASSDNDAGLSDPSVDLLGINKDHEEPAPAPAWTTDSNADGIDSRGSDFPAQDDDSAAPSGDPTAVSAEPQFLAMPPGLESIVENHDVQPDGGGTPAARRGSDSSNVSLQGSEVGHCCGVHRHAGSRGSHQLMRFCGDVVGRGLGT